MQNKQGSTAPDESTEEAEFLLDNFEVTEREAAELVGGEDESGLNAKLLKRQGEKDELQDDPTPEAAPDETVPDSDEERLKPVLKKNRRHSRDGS